MWFWQEVGLRRKNDEGIGNRVINIMGLWANKGRNRRYQVYENHAYIFMNCCNLDPKWGKVKKKILTQNIMHILRWWIHC